jgi:N-acyl-D-amino-acid deacylase
MVINGVSGEPGQDDLLEKYVRHPFSAFCTDAEDYGRGRPHPAAYGAFPRILSRYVRKRGSLSLEEGVRKMTSYPAALFGLKDRGVIRPGALADLVIFNRSKIKDRATFENPRREAKGVSTVIVNGRVAFEGNEFKDPSRGKVIRRDRT